MIKQNVVSKQIDKCLVQIVRLLNGIKYPMVMVSHRSTIEDFSLSIDIEIYVI